MNIIEWLIEKVAEETGEKAVDIAIDQNFESMNFDSLSILSLAHEIESQFALEVDPTALSEYDTIEKLSQWIETNK